METRVLSLNGNPDTLSVAANVLRKGGLVAFPTETVYGLGANALDASAVAAIYVAKGRPARNPIIVHVSSVEQAQSLVSEWPAAADRLAQAFWPGPLTLILKKNESVPSIVTAGGETVAIRMPSHEIARALLEAVKLPLAAPSANPSEQLSATTADHVRKGLGGKIDLIIDGGPTPGGLESTVIDLTVDPPVVRRPGLLTPFMLLKVLPQVETNLSAPKDGPLLSPGTLARHYAPLKPLTVVDAVPPVADASVGFLLLATSRAPVGAVYTESLPASIDAYAAGLYSALHRLEELPIDRIIVERPPRTPEFEAVHDRLNRAETEHS